MGHAAAPRPCTWHGFATQILNLLVPSVLKGTCQGGTGPIKILGISEGLLSAPTYPPAPLVLLSGHDRSQDLALAVCAEWGCPLLAPTGTGGPGEQRSRRWREDSFPRSPVHLGRSSWEAYRGGSWLPEAETLFDLASDGSIQRRGSLISQGRVMTVCDSG